MNVRPRVIPCLLLDKTSLVKTVKFKSPSYVGDPANTVRIFNELEVDELCILDISATRNRRPPNWELLEEIASEAFMPLSYGGGVRDTETAGRLLRIGFEKVIINTAAVESPDVVGRAAAAYGSQAIIVSIDARKKLLGGYDVVVAGATRSAGTTPLDAAIAAERAGAGEILLTSVDREGTWRGFDLDLVRSVTRRVRIPVIANGGAGDVSHIGQAIHAGGAQAVALGSMVVYQGRDLGVLVNFPESDALERELRSR